MKEFKDFINELNTDKPIDCIITFFIDNEWFGETLRKKNGKIILSDEQIEFFTDKLTPFLGNKDVSIYEYFKEKFPETYKLYNIFQSETQVAEETTHYIVDFMLYRLNKELFFYSDNEMEELLSNATFELIKAHGDIFTFFIAWLKLNHKTAYQKDYLHSVDRITPVASIPKLVKYWDFKRNKGIDINLTSANSYNSVHWRDKACGYEWEESIKGFNGRADGCPFCTGKQNAIILGKNDIFTICPELTSIYDFETNERSGVDICSLAPNSKIEAHFKCKKCGNEWDSPIANRTKLRNGKHVFVDCPKCSNKLFRKKPYSEEYPDLAAMYRNDLNHVKLDSIKGAKAINYTYYHWKCLICGETFESTLGAMTQSHNTPTKGCPYCSHTKVRKGESFGDVHPELIEEYDPSNEIDIFKAFPNGKESVKWVCKDCDHTWEATFALRHMGSGKCPECYKVGRNIKEECFAAIYPEYVELWSSDNERTPYDTFYTSNLWIKWKCAKCNGIYGANINDMVNGVTKCPYCRGTKILAGFNSFAHNHPELLDELDEIDNYLLPVTPDEVSDESSQKFWWTCKKNTKHKYPMSPKTRLMFQKRNREPCLYCRGQRRKLNHFVEYNPKKQQ